MNENEEQSFDFESEDRNNQDSDEIEGPGVPDNSGNPQQDSIMLVAARSLGIQVRANDQSLRQED